MNWKERFELDNIEEVPFDDADFDLESSWWYPRYVNFALDEDIITKERYFRPNEPITEGELNDMINRARKTSLRLAKNQNDTQTIASGDPEEQTIN